MRCTKNRGFILEADAETASVSCKQCLVSFCISTTTKLLILVERKILDSLYIEHAADLDTNDKTVGEITEFKKAKMNIISVINLFRKKPKFLQLVRRKSQPIIENVPAEKVEGQKEKGSRVYNAIKLYMQVVTCFASWKVKTDERVRMRKVKKERETRRRTKLLLGK